MNRTTVHKYVEMRQIAVNINKAMKDLDDKCKYSLVIMSGWLKERVYNTFSGR